MAAPIISNVAPSSGPAAGGTSITITGTNFATATGVTVGGQAATDLVAGATTITCTTPAHAAGATNVVVTNPDGSDTAASAFTYIAAPTFTSVSPDSGPAAGGTDITITGTNLTTTSGVTVGGQAATDLVVVGATEVTCTTPAHAAGAVNIVITSDGGTATGSSAFTYIAAPTVTEVTPSSGQTGVATEVTITGTALTDASSVTFGGQAATSVTVVSPTEITCTTPARRSGSVTVAVTTPGGTGSKSRAYSFVGAAPPDDEPVYESRSIVLQAASDDAKGALPYVTVVDTDLYASEWLPADAEIGDKYLNTADNNIYAVNDDSPLTLELVGPQALRLVDPWDGEEPTDGASPEDENYPDASYFGSGPLDTGNYVNIQDGVVHVFAVEPANDYSASAVKNGGKSLSPVAVGATPSGAYSVANLFAAQAEVDVPLVTAYSTNTKTALLKFYNILDNAGKLTDSGAVLANRLSANATSEPAGNLYTDPSQDPWTGEWTGAADTWTADPHAQMVDFETGGNNSVGFKPGRDS